MEILKTFGFEPAFFLAQIINFLILFIVFKKFLYKPILKILDERAKKVKKGIEDADIAARDRANAEDEKNKIIRGAGIEAEKIFQETNAEATKLREKILSEAKISADKIITEGHNQAKLAMDEMEKRAKAAGLDVAGLILEKTLKNAFTKEEKDKILKRNMEIMKGYNV